ncbi:MAG: hypothetical protein KGD64_09320 [Candidatus Heimdallarchaeota archaeon]|nr:hypothetical protein [Candidatus Heimdallarchaeota archaeon]
MCIKTIMGEYLSKNYKKSDFPQMYKDLTIDDKINIFVDRVKWWQLDVADKIINGYIDEVGREIPKIPDSNFATLSVVLSYFEMIGKYCEGYTDKSKARHYFTKGFLIISKMMGWGGSLPITDEEVTNIKEIVEENLNTEQEREGLEKINIAQFNMRGLNEETGNILYEEARCCLYHTGITSRKIRFGDFAETFVMISVSGDRNFVIFNINPSTLPNKLLKHLQLYEEQLRNEQNVDMRKNFEKRFDYNIIGKKEE